MDTQDQDQEKTFSISDRQQEISKKKKVYGNLKSQENTEVSQGEPFDEIEQDKITYKEAVRLIIENASEPSEDIPGEGSLRIVRHMWTSEEEEMVAQFLKVETLRNLKPMQLAIKISEHFQGIHITSLRSKIYNIKKFGIPNRPKPLEVVKIAEPIESTRKPYNPVKVYFSAADVPDQDVAIIKEAIIFAGVAGTIKADIEITGTFKIKILKQH